jgi:hypothetical protein
MAVNVGKITDTQSNALAQCAVKNEQSLQPQATHIALVQCAVGDVQTHKKTAVTAQCAYCGADFLKRTTWQKYCNEVCRDDAQFVRTGKRPWRGKKIG